MGNLGSCVGRSGSAPKEKTGGVPDTPAGHPTPPGKPVAKEITETSIHIEWEKPVSDGGSEIFAYIIKMCRQEGRAWKKLDADCQRCEYVAKDLDSGQGYKFFVQCENDNGTSKPSEISDIFQTKMPVVVPNDVNENVEEKVDSNAEKDVKTDDKKDEDQKSIKSNASAKSNHSDKSDNSKKSQSSKSSKKSDGGSKAADESTSSVNPEDVKLVEATVASGISNEKDFATEADDNVGCGVPLSMSAYSYSNDSLLDEDDDKETQHRFNDRTLPTPPITFHTTYDSSIEEYHTVDNEIPDEHRDLIMALNINVDPEYNRLSIISERSVEDSIGTPDPNVSPTKDGSHFTFVKKFIETSRNTEDTDDNVKKETEETNTRISGTEISTMVVGKSQTECKPMETRIPMMNGKKEIFSNATSSVSTEVSTSVQEIKVQSKIPTVNKSSTEDIKVSVGTKSSIPEPTRKSSIPEGERRSSIPELERKSSIPKLASKDKSKADKSSPSHIPRRDSAGKVSPLRSDSVESTKSNSEKVQKAGANSDNPSIKSGIPTSGIARRGSKDSIKSNGSPQSGSKIPSPVHKSGIPAPGGISGIPAPGTRTGIPAPRVNVS